MLSINPLLDCPTSSNGGSPFVWKYCRMCALEVRQGVYIFGEEGKRLQIPEKIRKTVAILVLEEDILPKKICTSCCTSLEAYAQFKDSVVDAQDKLTSIAKSIEKSQEQQSLLQLRSKQLHRSPKRPKLLPSSASVPLVSHSTSHHVLVPAPSLVAGEVVEVEDPIIDCDDPPSNAPSVESYDGEVSASKPVQECKASVEEAPVEPLQLAPVASSSRQISTTSTSTSTDSPPRADTSPVSSHPHPRDPSGKNQHPTSSSSEILQIQGEFEENAFLICGICTGKQNDKNSLDDHHAKRHENCDGETNPLYGCSACPRVSSNYEAIRQHIYRHRMAGTFKCADCDKSFPTKDQLHVHISSKHNPSGNKAFPCQTCGKQYGTNIALLAHQKKKHFAAANEDKTNGEVEEDLNSTADLRTNKASSSSNTSPNSNRHETPRLTLLKPIPKLDLQANKRSFDQTPSSSAKSSEVKNQESGYWKCDACDKILQTKQGYDVHVATHKGRRYECEQCGVSYTQKTTLDHHIKIHHTNVDNEFECSECHKLFKTIRQLTWHKRTHAKPLTDLRCPQCEKKFLNLISLKTHLRLHKGAKKYTCSECPKSFYSKQKLEEHTNSHTGRRPIGCPVENCSKVFSCFSNYAKHFKKNHRDLLGPRGKLIPPPRKVEDNNNVPPVLKKLIKSQIQGQSNSKGGNVATQNTGAGEKDFHYSHAPLTIPSLSHAGFSKGHELAAAPTAVSVDENPSHSHLQSSHALPTNSQLNQRPATTIGMLPSCANLSSTNINNLALPSSSAPSYSTTGSQTSSSNANSSATYHNSNPHSFTATSFHSTGTSTQDNLNVAHNNNQPTPTSSFSLSNHPINPHTSPNSAHSNSTQTQTNPLQSHPHQLSQFQAPVPTHPQPQTQSVWQPIMLPSSKTYHHPSGTGAGGVGILSGFDILECPTITPSAAHPSESHGHHHHQSQLNQTTTALVPVSVVVAHHSTTSSHAPHGVSLVSSASSASGAHSSSHHHLHSHAPNIHHPSVSSSSASSHTHSIAHSNSTPSSSSASASSAHSIPISSSCSVNVPHFVPSQQSEPMELSYKLDSNNFQEMPMELTKVFQRDPLELCVRQEFHGQPLMDLSSRVVNVTTVGTGNLAMNLNGTNSTSGSGGSTNTTSNQHHYGGVTSGVGSTTSSGNNVLNMPYHKSVELIERELTLNDFSGAFRQPIDLISRTDDQSHELCSEGNLVDLSLRSSFGQDQSASSFLRELIDLSSRSDTFHGEINLTNKPNSQSQTTLHHHHHHQHNNSSSHSHSTSASSSHHSVSSKQGTSSASGNNSGSHHTNSSNHHSHHHHHHHVQNQSHPASGSATVTLQNVIYSDLGFSNLN